MEIRFVALVKKRGEREVRYCDLMPAEVMSLMIAINENARNGAEYDYIHIESHRKNLDKFVKSY